MAVVGSAEVLIKPSFSGLQKQVASASGQIRGGVTAAGAEAGKGAGQKMGSGILAAAKRMIGPLAAIFAGAKIKDFIGDAITEASDLQQSTGGVQAIFKDHADEMIKISQNAAQRFGLSQNEFNELASQLGAGLKNKGIKDYAKQTEELIGLGSDLAAQFGGSSREAVEAISSALRGETDPIERYGVAMNQAAIQAKALEMGLAKPVKNMDQIRIAEIKATQAQKAYSQAVKEHGKESDQAQTAEAKMLSYQGALEKALKGSKVQLNDQEKATAALALLRDQTADATGAFAREEDTLAGVQQRASAQWTDLKAKIGMAFLPALSAAMNFVNKTAIPAIDKLTDGLAPATAAIARMVGWIKEHQTAAKIIAGVILTLLAPALLVLTVRAATAGAAQVATWTKSAAGAVKSAAVQFASLYRVAGGWALAARNAVQAGLAQVGAWLRSSAAAIKSAAVIVAQNARAAASWAVQRAAAVGAWLAMQAQAVRSAAVTAASNARAAASFVAQRAAMLATSIAQKAVAAGQWLINAAMSANPIGLVIGLLVALVGGLVLAYKKSETFRKIVNAAWAGIKAAALAVWNWIKDVLIPFFTQTIPQAFRDSAKMIKNAFSKVIDFILAPIRKARDGVIAANNKIIGAFRKVKDWVGGTWKKGWSKAKEWVSGAVSKGKDAVVAVYGPKGPFRRAFSSVKDWVGGTWKKGWSKVKGWVSGAVESGKNQVGKALGAKEGIRKRFNDMKSWTQTTWKKGWNKAKDWISDPVGNGKRKINEQKELIKKSFNALDTWGKDKFGPKWDKMKDKLKGPATKALKTFRNLFGRGGTVRTLFNGFITAAKTIFGKLKSAVLSPIKAVINAINKHLIKGGINWILGKLGVKKENQVPWIPVPKFASGGRVRGTNAYQRGGTDRVLALLDHDEQVINREARRRAERALPGGLDYLNRTGEWPERPQPGVDQQARPGNSVPIMNLADVPANLVDLARRGPRRNDRSGLGSPVSWAEAHEGAMGWYQRCLAFVNAAWNFTVGRFRLATARQSMNAGPTSTTGVPPAGAGVYWDTGPYGHVALAAGDGTVYSNDIRQAGRIDQVPQQEINKWGPYRGWWHPQGAAPGKGGGLLGMISGVLDFLKGLSPHEWLRKKVSGFTGKDVGGGAFGVGLIKTIPKMIIDKAKDWIAEKMGGGEAGAATWTGGRVGSWNQDQLNHAATIINVARQLGFGDRGALIGLITAMQESTLRNLSWGDRDSVGLFQQRAPWGSFADRTNPPKSASMFFLGGQGGQRGLKAFNWRGMSPGAAAQAVQVSAFPGAYSKWTSSAQSLINKFDVGGVLPPGLSLAYNGTGAGETVRTAKQEAALSQPATVINIKVDGTVNDDRTIARLIRAIEQYQRRRGPIQLTRT